MVSNGPCMCIKSAQNFGSARILFFIYLFFFIGGRDVLEGWSSLLVVHFQFHHLGLLRLFVSSFFCCYCCEL